MKYDKLVIAVLQGDDYPDVVRDLNEHGFYVTVLNSSGGFLKKRSVTIMVGVEGSRLDDVKAILKLHAGSRMSESFQPGGVGMPAMPVQIHTGGAVVFVLNMESSEKY